MQRKIAQYQELQKWRSKVSTVVAACHIVRARVQGRGPDGPGCIFQLLVESITGSWRVSRTITQLNHFISSLDQAFPIEAGRKGSDRILPSIPMMSRTKMHWSMGKKAWIAFTEALSELLRGLLMLPPYISRSRMVIDFLLPMEEEMYPTSLSRSISSSSQSFSDGRSEISQISNVTTESTTVRIKHSGRQYVLEIGTGGSFTELDRRLRRRLGAPYLGLAYYDLDHELISVRDDEDFEIAEGLLGTNLEILALIEE